jgi:hypothetical protein
MRLEMVRRSLLCVALRRQKGRWVVLNEGYVVANTTTEGCATAAGAVAIGALAIRALAVKRSRIGRLNIEELEVGRLHVRKLVVEQEQRGGAA